jgi:transposase-like protein
VNFPHVFARCKITLDGHAPSHQALRLLRRENPKWKNVLVKGCPYLNNIVEQDHRVIKRRCASMLGFKSFGNAAITLAGIELAHLDFGIRAAD